MERFSIPSKFSLTNDNIIKNNPSFHAVKLRMMSSGKNWNGSDFVIESLDLAKDTVSYAPILANIVQRDDGQLDCNGHDIDFEMKVEYNGNVTFKETYIEKPVGVFLANSCEKKYDEENDVYYLEALGYIWKQYSDVYDILKRDEVKDVSVEIEVEEGSWREDGYYEIRQFNLLGCTILGNGNLPAIDHSKIEFNFSMNNKEYIENLEKLNELLQNFSLKGGESMENEELKVEEVVEESATFEVEEPKEEIVMEEEEKCSECGKPLDECECEEVIEEESKEENKEEEYSHEEVIGEAVSEEVDERIYTQVDLDLAVERTIAEFSEAMEELERLREFKAEYDRKIALQELNDKMDTILVNFNVSEDLVKELKEKVINGEYSLEKFELELYRNNTPMKKEYKKEEKQTKLPIVDSEEKMSEVDKFFARYNVPKRK